MILWSIAMVIGVQIGFELSFYFSTAIISLIFTVSLSALAIKTFLNRSRTQIEEFNMSPIERAKGSISCCGGGLIAGITGIGGGVAIPHGKSKGVKQTTVAIAKLAHPIEWETLDEEKVSVVFLFAVRDVDANTTHILLLQQVAILLADDSFIRAVQEAKSVDELYQLIISRQANIQ